VTAAIFSDQQRRETVLNFISARLRGSVRIKSFSKMIQYLKSSPVRALQPFEKINAKGAFIGENEAESYFDFLVAVVTGAVTGVQKTVTGILFPTSTMIQEAIDQLFAFILAMREDMEIREEFFVVPSWEHYLASIENKLSQLDKKLENRDEKITKILTQIYEWMRRYQRVLDEAEKDYVDTEKRLKGAEKT